MEGFKTKISDLRMEPAANGVIISWCERIENKDSGKGTFDNCRYDYPKEVYDFDQDGESDGIDKAFTRFKEIWMQQYAEAKSKMK